MRDTRLTGCMNNGLTLASGVSNGSHGPARSLSFDIDHSQITGNHDYNLRVATETRLANLSGKVQNTNLSDAGLIDVGLDQLAGTTTRTTLDFGGGALRSIGHNCIDGGVVGAEALLYKAQAEYDWWGHPGPPTLARTIALAGSLDSTPALNSPPDCGTLRR
jgi:hypothetical protein